MSTINESGIKAIEEEYRKLQDRAELITKIKGLLSTTPSEKLIYEVVIPCSHPKHHEARIQECDNLKYLLEKAVKQWNELNGVKQELLSLAQLAYVFVVFGEQSYAVPGEVVEKFCGIKTGTFDVDLELSTTVVPSKRPGWV